MQCSVLPYCTLPQCTAILLHHSTRHYVVYILLSPSIFPCCENLIPHICKWIKIVVEEFGPRRGKQRELEGLSLSEWVGKSGKLATAPTAQVGNWSRLEFPTNLGNKAAPLPWGGDQAKMVKLCRQGKERRGGGCCKSLLISICSDLGNFAIIFGYSPKRGWLTPVQIWFHQEKEKGQKPSPGIDPGGREGVLISLRATKLFIFFKVQYLNFYSWVISWGALEGGSL